MDPKHPTVEFVLHVEIAEHLLDGNDTVEGAADLVNRALDGLSEHGERVEAHARPLSEILSC